MFLHKKKSIEDFFGFISSQKYEYLFVLLISLLLHSIDQHCFYGPGLVWICFSESVFGLCFFSLFPRAKAKQQYTQKKERGPFAPVISAMSAPPTHAPQSALAQVAGQGSSCVIRVLSLSWQGLGGLSLLRDLSTLDLSLVAGFGKPCLCPQWLALICDIGQRLPPVFLRKTDRRMSCHAPCGVTCRKDMWLFAVVWLASCP